MNEFTPLAVMTGDLDAQSDEALRDLIDKAGKLLERRRAERQTQALAEIKRRAKEHGLDVTVNRQPRKRGRPARKGGPA